MKAKPYQLKRYLNSDCNKSSKFKIQALVNKLKFQLDEVENFRSINLNFSTADPSQDQCAICGKIVVPL